MLSRAKLTVLLCLLFSIAVHAYALFGITLVLPTPKSMADKLQPLHVVLVNSKSKSRPVTADALAQANLDGGGNTEEDRQAKTMLPNIGEDNQITPEQSSKQIAQLEEESRRMMTQLKQSYHLQQPQARNQQSSSTISGDDLVQKSLEIARLEAQINKNNEYYQKMPRRKFIGARTQEYRFAQYIEDWRVKVERIGNLNYPEQARRDQIYGKLQLSVSIKADGSVENIEVSRTSGHRLLDAAAVRIVKLASPFSPLPANITKDVDILTITRTWSFTQSDKLESE
ncbi:MAG: energy transducer TonB [Gallionellales bacterium RIFOXYB12_FULL_54_9]|nr:MAG: energy transducer TonB [Gallionellales bacterium RIFOXYB12_FULL_54_9]